MTQELKWAYFGLPGECLLTRIVELRIGKFIITNRRDRSILAACGCLDLLKRRRLHRTSIRLLILCLAS